jgi:cytidylate kinase
MNSNLSAQTVESDDAVDTAGRLAYDVRSQSDSRLVRGHSHDVQEIVERQVKAWKLQRDHARERPREEPWPLIAISREFAARGTTIAKAIAGQTGFSVWDTELVHAVAEQIGADPRILESLEEEHRNAIEDAIQGVLMGTAYMKSDYLHGLMQVIHTIATHGGSIVVGRGANLVLDPADVLRVRLIAPIEDRIRWYIEKTGLSEREARHAVKKMDEERAEFIHDYFRRDIHDPTMYDLIINASMFSVERVADVVLTAYDAKFHRQPGSRSTVRS